MLSVIIPAHNEESVIERCLRAVCDTARRDELEVIVAANGCTDRTVSFVRGVEGVRVLELPEASKHAALVAGDAAAAHHPRAFLDADVEVTGDALLAVAEAMVATGALGGAPRLELDLTGCPWFVRSYYRVWCAIGWSVDAPIGSGIYVLSEEGRRRVGEFPDVTNDDQYVHDVLLSDERMCLSSEVFVVRPPRTLKGLVLRRTRTTGGQQELDELFGPLPGRSGAPGPTDVARRDPRRLGDVIVFLAVKALAMLASRRKRSRGGTGWERDDSSRGRTVAE